MHTRKKLDVTLDYLNDDIDTGPTHDRKHTVENRGRGHMREHWNRIAFIVNAHVGKEWDECYSRVCAIYDSRTYIGQLMRQNAKDKVLVLYGWPSNRSWTYFYLDSERKIQGEKRDPYIKPVKPVDKVYWYGGWWFIREDRYVQHPKCGCLPRVFRDRSKAYSWKTKETCAHGNEKVSKENWVLREYGKHDPDSVYEVITSTDSWGARRYKLQPGERKTIYYRDVPEKIDYTVQTKTPNGQELKVLKALLSGAVVSPKLHEMQSNIRPLNRHKDNKPRKRLRADKNYPQDFSCVNPRYVARNIPHTFRVR